ncbi:hypothetical protein PTTG_05604 [Puccinia triticina 1-1 BBBD Race 1]|uniref:Uncharacterized protein n=2 Tax=Puccinia triticina TaxID=208348 RepID=A0A0C4EXQ5_PUCT1|nr:uncharacterized protein PtA15_11A89 [Puccinia triticina]OAV93197.1 hypothetical protein PTTG_05604 [Puccinia triticina 1-1 BBBD Race 1]WAQ89402.1 hypothetical protein PtA15_11A89 [Puccinia triticina]WAR59456.1 hypothetical protein PtB15_11B96 [Puccinia triticina]
MSHDASQKLESSSNDDQPHEPLMITDAPADSSDQDTKGHSIAVGGEGVQLDHLGPMVINSDGVEFKLHAMSLMRHELISLLIRHYSIFARRFRGSVIGINSLSRKKVGLSGWSPRGTPCEFKS